MLAARYEVLDALNEYVDAALAEDDPVDTLRRALETHSDDPEIARVVERRINSAGYAAASADELNHAQAILEVATEVFPNSANAWDSLAEILLYRGDRDKAIAYYQKALEVDPDFANAARQLEKISQQGDE